MYVVYMDVLFCINFIMDTIIFWIVSMLINQPVKVKRMIAGGLFAAVLYCMLIVVPFLQYVPYSIYSFFIPVFPILYIFRPIHIKQLFKYYLLSMLVAALLGGTTFSLWYMLGYDSRAISELNIFMLIGIGVTMGFTFYTSFYYIRRRFILPTFEYQLQFIQKDRKVMLRALLDTGNCLYTPITHRPVIVVEYDMVKGLFTEEEQKFFERFSDHLVELEQLDDNIIKHLIPFNSIGCESGMILGVEIDEMILEKMSTQRHFNKCIIGIAQMPLFNDHSYKALLHPEYIIGEVG